MKIEQKSWTQEVGWVDLDATKLAGQVPQIILAFGERQIIENPKRFNEIRLFYPSSPILMCSTAGEILGDRVNEHSISLSAVYFEKSTIKTVQSTIENADQSLEVGKKLAKGLPTKDLVHAMVFSDGLKVNGTALVEGLNENLPSDVSVTGGLMGDGPDFKKTVLGLDEIPADGRIILIGFYSTALKIGYGSLGGWDTFGVERVITKAKGNVLYELDGKPALKLYKEYLGDKAEGLPSTGLLFPLRLKVNDDKQTEVVRTILGVDEKTQSMTFAGDMPINATVSLMKANFERLIDGAAGAANMSIESLGQFQPELSILISCIGRKLVLKERLEEEIESVRSVVGDASAMAGFYSYGELCPTASADKQCRLHNQTMTITTFREI